MLPLFASGKAARAAAAISEQSPGYERRVMRLETGKISLDCETGAHYCYRGRVNCQLKQDLYHHISSHTWPEMRESSAKVKVSDIIVCSISPYWALYYMRLSTLTVATIIPNLLSMTGVGRWERNYVCICVQPWNPHLHWSDDVWTVCVL